MATSTRVNYRTLDGTLDLQLNVITRAQALGAGVTPSRMRHMLRDGGSWQVLLPQVWLAATGTPSRAQLEIAAQLYGGPGSIITGPAALPCHRIAAEIPELIDVLVPVTLQRRDAGFVRLHRTVRLPRDFTTLGPSVPIRYALAARAVGDTVRGLPSLREVQAIVADAVQRRRCSLNDLIAELDEGPRNNSGLFRQALVQVAGGVRSVAEADLRKLLAKSSLPMPLFNAELWLGNEFVARPDAWYPEFGIAIEVDSTEWHTRPKDHQEDVRRQTRMGRHLIVVLRFKPWEIRHEPGKVIAAIADAIERAAGRPSLNLRVVPAA
jgi:hypothetical protein